MTKDYPKFYITTSIAYINAKPHLGHLMELVQADSLARYAELFGQDVFFSTGTDEHGMKIQRSAAEKGLEPEKFAEEIASYFEELTKTVNATNDAFIRTSAHPTHKESVNTVWKAVADAGYLYKKQYTALYCVGDERFMTEKELVDGKCPNHPNMDPEEVSEENWFFALSKFRGEIERRITSGEILVRPESKKKEILNLIKDGLDDISVSREKEKLQWGIPVPGDDSQVMYVWFDALTNYISVLGYGTEQTDLYNAYWASRDSYKLHLIGKDILRQHAAIWIGMLLAAELPLPNEILVHGFITSDGKKMSKSLGNVVDPFEICEKYGADAVRYYLLSQVPTLEDGDFSNEHFHNTYEADLKNGLGNLVNRITNIVEKKLDGTITPEDGWGRKLDIDRVRDLVNDRDLKKANEQVAKWTRACDALVNENELWDDTENKKKQVYEVLDMLLQIAVVWMPVMPHTCEQILKALGKEGAKLSDIRNEPPVFDGVAKPIEPLFPPIEATKS